MRAIVTVIGKDQVGIIASVCALLAGEDINVLNISQSVLQEYFVMVMLVDLSGCQTAITEISDELLSIVDYFIPNEHNPHFITLAMLHSNFPGSQIYIAQAQGQCFADPEAGIGQHCNNSVIPKPSLS